MKGKLNPDKALLDYEKIDREIENEFKKLLKHIVIKPAWALTGYLENLYNAFCDKPYKFVELREFLGVDKPLIGEEYVKLKANSHAYCNRISKYLDKYYHFVKSNVIFWIEKETKRAGKNQYNDIKSFIFFRLRVHYNSKDYSIILDTKKKAQGLKEKKVIQTSEQDLPNESTPFLFDYLQKVVKNHRYLDLKYLGGILLKHSVIKLDKLYIRLKATENIPLSEASHMTEHMCWLSGATKMFIEDKRVYKPEEKSPTPIEVVKILQTALKENQLSKRHIVFLGAPGSGKTTLLRYLANSFASGQAEQWEINGFVPFFIDLPEYVRSKSTDLIDYVLDKAVEHIPDEVQKNEIKKALEYKINQCQNNEQIHAHVIFLLDSLDETRDKKHVIVKEIERLCNRYEKAFIIVSSRIMGYHEAYISDFSHYLLDDLDELEITNFVSNWFNTIAEDKAVDEPEKDWATWAKERINYLTQQIKTIPSIKRIATSPLFLSFLVFLDSYPETDLSKTRSDLYQRYFDKLIFNWEEKHKLPSSRDVLLEVFREMSWIIHRSLFRKIQDSPTKAFIKRSIAVSDTNNLDELINFWIESGIFVVIKTKGLDELILPRHLSFIEYGFAYKLAELWDDKAKREDVWKTLKLDLHNKHLYEPIILFFDIIEDSIEFFSRIWNLKEDIFFRNLFLLTKIVNEVKFKTEYRIITKIVQRRLIELFQSESVFVSIFKEDIFYYLYLLESLYIFIEQYENETNKRKREEIALYISKIDDVNLLPILELFYKHETEDSIRYTLLNGILRLAEKNNISLLKQLYRKEIKLWHKKNIALKIGKLGDTEFALTHLINILKEDPGLISHHCATAVAEIGDKNLAMSILKKNFEMKDYPEQLEIVGIIEKIGGKNAIPVLVSLLRKTPESTYISYIKEYIAQSIGKLGDKHTLTDIENILQEEPNSDLNKYLAYSLGIIGNIELSLSLLKSYLDHENDIKKREKILHLMLELCHEVQIPISTLKELFEKIENPDLKITVATLIGKYGDKKFAILHLKNLFEHESNPENKCRIASSIAKLGDSKFVIPRLKEFFEKAWSPEDKCRVAMLIWDLGEKEFAILHLKNLFDQISLECREDIIHWIRWKGDMDTFLLLSKRLYLLGYKYYNIEDFIEFIAGVKHDAIIPFLKQLYNEEKEVFLKTEIALQIGHIGDTKFAVPHLIKLFEKESESERKYTIAFNIAYLGDPEFAISIFRQAVIEEREKSLRNKLLRALLRFAQERGFLIFEENRRWNLVRINERYSL